MKHSDTIGKLAEALSQAQGEFQPAEFDSVNPHYKSRYASLTAIMAAIRAPMAKHGLSLSCGYDVNPDGSSSVTGLLMHASGEWISCSTQLILQKQDMQGLGSATTYARRYIVSALLGIVSDEDDDGEAATKPPGPKKEEKPNKVTAKVTVKAKESDIPDPKEMKGGAQEMYPGPLEMTPAHAEAINQLRKFKAWTSEDIVEHIKRRFGVDQFKLLTIAQYEKLKATLQIYGPNEAKTWLDNNPSEGMFQ